MRALPAWHARPNFHFGHFQRAYCWTCNERDIDEYVQLWVGRIEREAADGQVTLSWPPRWIEAETA